MKERRKTEKQSNRQVLIEATLDCIAELGLLGTTVSEMYKRQGLSRGMIHLHFDGKSNLIVEAAKVANHQYFEVLNRNIETAASTPNCLIEAVIRSDLCEACLNKRTASIWYELRGASRSNPTIAKFSDTRDQRLRDILKSASLEVCRQEGLGDAQGAANEVTTGLIAFTEGMWTDFLLHPDAFDRNAAERVIFRFLAGIWPTHFSVEGAITIGDDKV